MKLTDFLEGPYLDAVLENGTFRHAAFYDIFGRALRESVLQKTGGADSEAFETGVSRDLFTTRFLGAWLWLLKYRTLSSNRNSPRKQAFLDMLFDIEIPRFIDKHLGAYDTAMVREIYDSMDIRCKKEYTGEMASGEPPPFISSPIWARGAQPTPFQVAAKVFTQLVLGDALPQDLETVITDKYVEKLALEFTAMTEPIVKASSGIKFNWSAPREDDTQKRE